MLSTKRRGKTRKEIAVDALASVTVAAVNVRFLRFRRPVVLAICAALLTACFTGVVASILWSQSCRTYRSTSPLPFITQQLGSDADCTSSTQGNQGWLLSDRISYSDGSFSKAAAVFYEANLTQQWQNWTKVINALFDLPALYTKSGANVTFGADLAVRCTACCMLNAACCMVHALLCRAQGINSSECSSCGTHPHHRRRAYAQLQLS